MNKYSNGQNNLSENVPIWSESSDQHGPEGVYEIYGDPSVVNKPIKQVTNGPIMTVQVNNPDHHSPRYSVLRDADSTVLDYGYENAGHYQPRPTSNRIITHLEGKRSHQNIESDIKPVTNRALRPHSTPATLLWLEENYEIAEGVCIPRSTLYTHYVDFCARNCIQPVNAASFGKIIRQQFPQLTTRRLGTRGQSRYHYYGIAVRENSTYYQLAYSKKAITSNNLPDSSRVDASSGSRISPTPDQVNSNRNRMGTVLPDFPSPNDFKLPSNLDVVKTATFLMMYRTHCQRILDTVIRANFDEIQTFVLYFWQGIPPHLTSILSSNSFINLIGICDSILYKCITSVLLPSALQTFPDSLTKVIRKFTQEFECWLKMALYNLPESLKLIKIDLSRRVSNLLKRQTSISHLIQAARMVVNNGNVTPQMIQDWKSLSTDNIFREVAQSLHKNDTNNFNFDIIRTALCDFSRLLAEESPIETYFDWLNALVQYCIINPSKNLRYPLKENSKHFLYIWSTFVSRIIRDLSINAAPSFGSFHLLRLLFDEYLLYIMEYCQLDEYIVELMGNVNHDLPPRPIEDYFFGEFCDETGEGYQPPSIPGYLNSSGQMSTSPVLTHRTTEESMKLNSDEPDRIGSIGSDSCSYASNDFYHVQGGLTHEGNTNSDHMVQVHDDNRKSYNCTYHGDYQNDPTVYDASGSLNVTGDPNYSRYLPITGPTDSTNIVATISTESAQSITSPVGVPSITEEAIFSVCSNLKTEVYPQFC